MDAAFKTPPPPHLFLIMSLFISDDDEAQPRLAMVVRPDIMIILAYRLLAGVLFGLCGNGVGIKLPKYPCGNKATKGMKPDDAHNRFTLFTLCMAFYCMVSLWT